MHATKGYSGYGESVAQRCLTVAFYMLVTAGGVSIQCLPTTVRSKVLEEYLPLGIGLALLLAAFVLLLVFRGRQIMTELSTARLNRIKKG